MPFSYEFDPQKSATNKTKHGIDFLEAQAPWQGKVARALSKQRFHGEVRYEEIGKIGPKHWTAIVTYRASVRRIISVRASTTQEIQNYERFRQR